MNTQDALKWVSAATEKPFKDPKERKCQREYALTPHVKDGLTVGVDGKRLHIVHEALNTPEELAKLPNYAPILKGAMSGTIRGKISKYHLLKAAMACKVFSRDSANIMRLSLNGSMVAMAQSAEYGDARVEIVDGDEWRVKFLFNNSPAQYRKIKKSLGELETYNGFEIMCKVVYQHKGEDLEIAFNVKYLIELLEGMPEVIEYRMKDANSPAYFAGEVDGVLREAVLMPMYICCMR